LADAFKKKVFLWSWSACFLSSLGFEPYLGLRREKTRLLGWRQVKRVSSNSCIKYKSSHLGLLFSTGQGLSELGVWQHVHAELDFVEVSF
jgi:hypothetical protein